MGLCSENRNYVSLLVLILLCILLPSGDGLLDSLSEKERRKGLDEALKFSRKNLAAQNANNLLGSNSNSGMTRRYPVYTSASSDHDARKKGDSDSYRFLVVDDAHKYILSGS